MNKISVESICHRNNEKFLFTQVEGEMVMMHLEKGEFIGMNLVASAIWAQLENPTRVSELVNHLLQTFEIDKETCQKETLALLIRMYKDEMVLLVN